MNNSISNLRQPGLLPGKGARAALMTKAGLINGVLVSWSDGGAVIEANGAGLAGAQVVLRVQGADRVWEKRATVLWVNKDQSFGLEFKPDGPAKKSWSGSLIPRIQQLFQSTHPQSTHLRMADNRAPAQPAKQSILPDKLSANQLPGGVQPDGKQENSTDKRRRRRFRIETPAQVMRLGNEAVSPDIATLTDASKDGVLFITDRNYPVGTRLLVKFPFPSLTSSNQGGNVVRVETLSNGRRRVAVAFA